MKTLLLSIPLLLLPLSSSTAHASTPQQHVQSENVDSHQDAYVLFMGDHAKASDTENLLAKAKKKAPKKQEPAKKAPEKATEVEAPTTKEPVKKTPKKKAPGKKTPPKKAPEKATEVEAPTKTTPTKAVPEKTPVTETPSSI